MNRLLPFQEEGVEFMLSRRHTLLADEMGLGKTAQVVETINRLDAKGVLIICPASVKRNWERELKAWLKVPRFIRILDKRTEDFCDPFWDILIVNYDLISHSNIFNQLTLFDYDLLVCDEAHYLKSMKAERTKAVLAKNGLVHRARRTVMMTGTPILNRPIELYPILKVLAPQAIAPYGDYWRFAHRFCDAWQDGLSLNVKGASHTDDLNRRLKSGYMIRRTTEEVKVQLPPKRYQMFFVETDASTEKLLFRAVELTRKQVKKQSLDIEGGGDLAILRRELAEKKVEACLEYVRNTIEGCGKLVIFAYHKTVIETLKEGLAEYGPVTLTGESSQSARREAIRRFTEEKSCQVFIGNIQAAGTGIDGLQHVCHDCLFLEWSWVPGEIEQAVKRVHRMGQTNAVLIQFLVWADSVEEHMLRTALDKVQVIREVLA